LGIRMPWDERKSWDNGITKLIKGIRSYKVLEEQAKGNDTYLGADRRGVRETLDF
jgi:hypothetical protein